MQEKQRTPTLKPIRPRRSTSLRATGALAVPTVYQLANQGRLKLTKIGKLTRILAQHEAEFAASLTSDAA